MEIFESVDKVLLFTIFFIPGFISMKVYRMFIAGKKVDFTKAVLEVLGFSSINFALMLWLIVLIHRNNFFSNHIIWYLVLMIVIMFLCPIVWAVLIVYLSKSRFFRKFALSSLKSPWDYFFDKRKSCWVIINLNNNERIGGVYSNDSFASAYPQKEQLYLEELWDLDADGNFMRKKHRTKGIIVLTKDIKSVEFYI